MSKRVVFVYFEEYACACVSEYVKSKKDLLGYCERHGKDRIHVYSVPATASGRGSPLACE